MNTKVHFSSIDQNWRTPEKLYTELDKEFNFDFDPCPPNPDFDGLHPALSWGKRNFVNPPYKFLKEWITKGYEEWQKGKTVVFLIPSRTDTKIWHSHIMQATEIRFIKGRLKFSGSKNCAPFPSAIIVFKGTVNG